MLILKSISILMALICLGMLSRITGIYAKGDVKKLSAFIYYFSLPALFISEISKIDILSINKILFLGSLLPIILLLCLLKVIQLIKLINKGTFVLLSISISMGSNAFFGLAFFEFFNNGIYFKQAVITASILGAFGVPITLLLFEYANYSNNKKSIIKKLFKNPLIISIISGTILSLSGVNDSFLFHPLAMLGKAAGSIAVFSLGIFLYDNFSLKKIKSSALLAAFRLVMLPLSLIIIFILFSLLNYKINIDIKQFLLLQTGIPAAIALVIFAERYEYKIAEISGLVILTSMGSLIFLLILYFFSIYFF